MKAMGDYRVRFILGWFGVFYFGMAILYVCVMVFFLICRYGYYL